MSDWNRAIDIPDTKLTKLIREKVEEALRGQRQAEEKLGGPVVVDHTRLTSRAEKVGARIVQKDTLIINWRRAKP